MSTVTPYHIPETVTSDDPMTHTGYILTLTL